MVTAYVPREPPVYRIKPEHSTFKNIKKCSRKRNIQLKENAKRRVEYKMKFKGYSGKLDQSISFFALLEQYKFRVTISILSSR